MLHNIETLSPSNLWPFNLWSLLRVHYGCDKCRRGGGEERGKEEVAVEEGGWVIRHTHTHTYSCRSRWVVWVKLVTYVFCSGPQILLSWIRFSVGLSFTDWFRSIGFRKLQVVSRNQALDCGKRPANYRANLREMPCNLHEFYASSSACMSVCESHCICLRLCLRLCLCLYVIYAYILYEIVCISMYTHTRHANVYMCLFISWHTCIGIYMRCTWMSWWFTRAEMSKGELKVGRKI